MDNTERMRQFARDTRGLSPADRDQRALAYEGKLLAFAVGGNPVYRAVQQVAGRMQAWIVTRKTNEASFQYVGRSGYTAKDITCKPKTADRDNRVAWTRHYQSMRTAGLVASPTVCPAAFSSPARLNQAREIWKMFERGYLTGNHGYEVNLREGSAHYGCLRRNHMFVHGDLDLFDVIRTPKPTGEPERIHQEQIDLETNRYTAVTRLAGNLINGALQCKVVLHGAQAHYGSFDDQGVQVFAPDGRTFELASTVQARLWYATRWPGRVPVGVTQDWLLLD